MDNTLKYNVVRVSEENFDLHADALVSEMRLNIHNNIQLKYDTGHRIFTTAINATLTKAEQDTPVLNVSAAMTCELDADSLSNFTVDNVLVIPETFRIDTIVSTFGMIQGIILARMKELGLQPILLPPVDRAAIPSDPLIVNLKDA